MRPASTGEVCSSGVALAPLDGVDAGDIQPGAAGAAQPGAGGAPPDNKIDAGALQPGAAGAAQPGAGGAHSAAAVSHRSGEGAGLVKAGQAADRLGLL